MVLSLCALVVWSGVHVALVKGMVPNVDSRLAKHSELQTQVTDLRQSSRPVHDDLLFNANVAYCVAKLERNPALRLYSQRLRKAEQDYEKIFGEAYSRFPCEDLENEMPREESG